MATITIPGMFLTGDHASRPAAGDVGHGTIYSCSTHALLYQSDGSSWSTWATLGVGDSTAHIADTSDAHDASAISIVDAGSYFTGTDVEAALQELGPLRTRPLNFIIDGGGSVITTGIKGDLEVPFAWVDIVSVRLLADASGSIVIDIWKDTYANFPPTDADSITASAPPTISSATKSEDSTLTGWTQTGSAGDILRFNVDSVTTITRVTVSLVLRI